MEDVAGQYFGVSISSGQVEDLTRDVASLAHRKQFGSEELDRILITVTEKAAQFFALFGNAAEGRTGFRAHEAFLEKNEGSLSRRAARAGTGHAATGAGESAAG